MRYPKSPPSTEAMVQIWTEHEASYSGEFVNFDKIWSYPKPTRKPPILLGGETDYTLKRIVQYCDGWIPRGGPNWDAKKDMARLHEMARQHDRDPKELSTTVFRGPPTKAELDGVQIALKTYLNAKCALK